MTDALVIGGGFSGALTALHLVEGGVAVLVVEPAELGRGVAYASELPGEQVPLGCAAPVGLLLNTPSAAMSALPDRPEDFVAWLAARGLDCTFAPRAVYGAYLRDSLGGVAQVQARAVDVVADRDGYRVACSDGSERAARHVVLALGNAPPRTPAMLRGLAGYHADPSGPVDVPRDRPVALLGSGLTALDVVATLRARGHTGPLIAISRRGRVPQLHPGVPAPEIAPPHATTLAGLLAWWRSAGDLARISDPLIASLLARGLVERDPLGLGAARLAPGLHAVGPWRVATEWESTAVAELRVQAVEVAQAIRTSLRAGPTRA